MTQQNRTQHPTPVKFFFFSSRRRHTRCLSDWSSDVCSSDLSSGVGELLGVTLSYSSAAEPDREEWKPFITQWGQDPIWQTAALADFPATYNFPDATATESGLPLDPGPASSAYFLPRRVDVAGHEVHYDSNRKLYYCDLTVDCHEAASEPF